MIARVAINGFGRVGRLCLRSMLDVPVEKIADLMIANKIKRVPVLSGERLVGIVSRADIIRAIATGQHIAMHTPIYDL
jgi:CBS domain-containing protein